MPVKADQDRQRPPRIIGTRPPRHDGVDKVTGRALFGADLKPAGILYGKILRSPHAHARIVSLDATPALSVPGVYAVVTSADLPPPEKRVVELGHGSFDVRDAQENTLASGKVRYCGQPVAAVAATSLQIAEQAIRQIEVAYEPLPAVFDVRAAMSEGAPLVQEDLFTSDTDGRASTPSNVAGHVRFEKGDVESGFRTAEKVFHAEFTTGLVHQGYLEPQVATAHWGADGTLTVWCSTQGGFSAQAQTAEVLGIPVSRVKVVPMEVGGAFGGKIGIYLEPVAALLSRKSGRPVKMTMDRREVFEATGPTPGSYLEVQLGATRTGRIVAARAHMAFEAGAFAGSSYVAAMLTIFGPYDIEHVVIDGYDVLVNKPRTAAYRAPCATQAAMACETLIDEVAEWADIDPLEIRRINAAREGTVRADGEAFPRIGYEETVATARAHSHYSSPLGGPNRGRGVASGYWFNVGMQSGVNVAVNADGTVSLASGSVDLSGTRTSVAMQLAEVLGIGAEDVRPHVVDTDSVGYNDVTAGSRVTFATGLAAIQAAKDIQNRMAERAAMLWDAPRGDVIVEGGMYRLRDGSRSMSFKELAGRLAETGAGPVVGHGSERPDDAAGGAFATHVVDVEVDPDTGKVTILRYTAVQDAGKAVHPGCVEGQMQGGAVQGIGWALSEEYCYDERGRMENPSFLDYRMPTTADVPWIDTVIVEVPNPGHPFGVRGVGEVPIVPPPAAIANAVYRATGVRFRDLPMKPSRVLAAILAKADGSTGE
jgi:xanthine dehydrogenase molybdenum-binding subunit